MVSFQDFRDIPVWKSAHQLVLAIYKISQDFPKSEIYGLTSQLRRAIASVAANIVEGVNRKTIKETTQFLYHSKGSIAEAQYFLLLAKDLEYLKKTEYEILNKSCQDVANQLGGWIKYLKQKS